MCELCTCQYPVCLKRIRLQEMRTTESRGVQQSWPELSLPLGAGGSKIAQCSLGLPSLALHLAHLLHSYKKISTDLPSCTGMALMERGLEIREAATEWVWIRARAKRPIWTLPPRKDRAQQRTQHIHTYADSYQRTGHKSVALPGWGKSWGRVTGEALSISTSQHQSYTGGWNVG